MSDKVQAALDARSAAKQKKWEDSQNRVNAALEARKKRLERDKESNLTDFYTSLNTEVEAAKKFDTSSYTSVSLADALNNTRNSRVALEKLRRQADAYRSYLGDEDANAIISELDKMSNAYDAYLRLAEYNESGSALDYDSYRAMKEKEQSITSSADFQTYVQKGKGVTNPSWEDTFAPLDLWGWKPFGDGDSVNNMVAFAEANKENALADSLNAVRSGGGTHYLTDQVNLINLHMTEEEKATYNYYLGKGEKSRADAYLSEMMEVLKQREAGKIVEQADDSKAVTLLFAAASGLEQFGAGIKNIDNYIMGTEADPTTSTQYASSMIREKLGDSGWGTAYDAVSTISNMLPSILVSYVPVVGQVAGLGTMGASAIGNSYAEMRNHGYDEWQSRGYATLVGASEMVLQSLLGGISKLGGKYSVNAGFTKLVGKIDNALARTAITLGGNMISEGLEEGIQTAIEPAFKAWMTGEEFEGAEWDEILYSSLLGAISAGTIEGIPTIAGTAISNRNAKKVYGDGSGLVAEGLELGGDVGKLADKYQTSRLDKGKGLTGGQINNLISKYDPAKMKSATEARLTELGETGDVGKIADVLVKQAMGESLTRAEKALIKESKYATRVANELNPDNIESGEYSSEWAENIGTKRINASSYNKAMLDLATERAELMKKLEKSSVDETISEKEKSIEGKYDVSESGKTLYTADGNSEEVSVKKVVSVDGGLKVELDDGRTVSASDLSLSEGDAIVYEMITKMNVSPETANVFLNAFKPTSVKQATLYFSNASLAYQYGKIGYEAGLKGINLSKAEKKLAYERGRKDAASAVKTQPKAKVDGKASTEGADGAKSGIIYENGFTYDEKKASDIQKASMAHIEVIDKLSNLEVHVFESKAEDGKRVAYVNGKKVKAPNGYFTRGNQIYIDINAGNGGEGAMLYTVSHEITHYIRRWNEAGFKELADFLIAEYGKQGTSVNALIEKQKERIKNRYAEDGTALPSEAKLFDMAYEEMVADAMSDMLADPKAYEKLIKLKAKNRTLWEKVGEAIKAILDKFKSALGIYKTGDVPVAREAFEVRGFSREAFEKLQDLYLKAFVEADANYGAAIGSRSLEDFADAKNENGETLFQYRAMEADEAAYREMLHKWGKMTDVQIDNLFSTIDTAMELIKDNLEILDYAWDADIDDRAFSPVKANSDKLYKVSLDFSTLCRKRILQQTVATQLQEALNKPLTKAEGIAIRDALIALQEEGRQIEVACALCYVESARMKSPAQIKRFIEGRETIIKDFFAGKSGGSVKEKIKQAEADAREKLHKEHPDGIKGKDGATMLDPRNATMGKLPKKYADEIREAKKVARESYKPTAEEQKLIEVAKNMTVTNFTSPEGLENLAKNYPPLFDAYASYIVNATHSKGIENDTWWRAGDSKHIGDVLIANMNKENGLRSQSWSDFQVVHILDYIASTIELATRNTKEQAYSKVPDYVELMGLTGVMINMSLIPTATFNGSLEYDSVEGIDYRRALELRDKYHATAGTICIGVDDVQIKLLLADTTIDYVIPFHRSGMAAHIRKAMHIPTWAEYQDYQSENKLSRSEAEKQAKKYGVKLLDASDPNYHVSTSFSEWFDLKEAQQIAKMENANPSNKALQKKYGVMYGGYMAMQNAANNYLKLCAERGIAPKFSHEKADFTAEENYWKLLIDRKMVDNITGEIIEQQTIKPIFDQGEVMRILNDEVARYPGVKADQDYAIRTVTEKMLSGEIKGGMSAEAIAKVMKKPVDNVANVNILASAEDMMLSDRDSYTVSTDFVSNMENIVKNRGEWYVTDVFDYVSNNPELNFIERIRAQDKDVKGNLAEFLGGIDDTRVLHLLSWYLGEAYADRAPRWGENGKIVYPYRGAIRTFRNAINKRTNEIMTAKVNGTNLGVKNGTVSLNEIKDMFNRLNSNEEIGEFAEKVFATADKLGVNIRFENQTYSKRKVAGDAIGDMIEYKTSYFNNTAVSNQKKASTILHELIHVCTVYVMNANPYAGDVYYTGSKSLNYEKIANAATRLNRIYMEIANDPDFKGEYGIKNAKEMVAELGNERFIGKLKQKNLWQKIVEWICELFGIKSNTSAYENARMCVDYILDNPEITEYKEFAAQQRESARRVGLNVFGKTVDNDGNILYSDRDSYAPTFYSHMGKVIDSIKLEKMGANGVVPFLKGRGVKDEEIKWSGIEAFLEGKKSVTKSELQEFVAASQLRIVEEITEEDKYEDRIVLWQSPQANVKVLYIDGKAEDIFRKNEYGHWVSDELGDIFFDEQEILDQVRSDYGQNVAKTNNTKWSKYKLDGGENYRELVFKMPNSTYSNRAMRGHWGQDAKGILVHARIQDFDVDGKKMLFIEELQSDWHNEGHAKGYTTKEYKDAVAVYDTLADEYGKVRQAFNKYVRSSEFRSDPDEVSKKKFDWLRRKMDTAEKRMQDAERDVNKLKEKGMGDVADAPFKNNYHEYVLKRLLRMAAEEGYDSIGWTPSEIQTKRWSDEYAEGYRIEYDQDMPKFLRKYGKRWGATVGTSKLTDGTDVWSMDITDSMKDSVLNEGQVLYSDRDIQPVTEAEYETLKKHFGVTANFKVAGYLLTDGKLLDFSGKHWGDSTSRSRQVDHRDVQEVLGRGNNGIYDMVDMIGSGNIRLMPEIGGINLAVYPNEKQRRVLSLYIKQMLATEGQVIIDYDTVGGDTVHSRVYGKYSSSSQILSDIRNYFNGARRSDLMNFHTSFSDRDGEVVSNRSLLVNALEDTVQNDIERNKLAQYKQKIALIESEQAKLAEIREKANALRFTKGRTPAETKEMRDLDFEANQIANRINTYDKQLLNLESTLALKNVLEREKKMLRNRLNQKGKEALKAQKQKDAETIRELLTRNQESRKKAIEGRHKTEMRLKIKDIVSDLNKLLLNPTKDQHVPIGLQGVVAEALDAINMDTMNAEERVAYYNSLIAKAKDPDEIATLTKKRDFFEYRDMSFKERITALKNAYAEFKESDDPLIRNAHNDAIEELIKNTADAVGNKSLKDMSLSQLEAVYDMYKAIRATVRNSNKMFKEGRQETITDASELVKSEVREIGGHKDRVRKVTKWLKTQGWNMLKPVYAVKMIGSNTFESLYDNVRAAEDTWAVDVSEAKEFYGDKAKKYNCKKWDFKRQYSFKDSAGNDFSLSLEQIMSLYAYSKREQADKHLEVGGFVFDDVIEVVEKNKIGIPVKYEVNDANPYRLRKEDLGTVIATLTEEQKGFIDEMQTYLSDVMGAKGNEVSLALYDIKLYKENNYFPLKTARYFREFDPEKNGTPKIKNSGFSKKTVPQAGNPIVLSNFMDVWAQHVNDMSMYHAFVLPLEDFMRVYNYSSTAGGYDSVQQAIKNAYGSGANQYIETLMDDLNGGARVDPTAGVINKMIGLSKKAAVLASASVVIQQPSALFRSMAYINPKYFVGTPKMTKHKDTWAEVKKYAPVALIKEMGYFDTGMGQSTVEWIKGDKSIREKADDVLSKAPALADEMTWCAIWKAVKRETLGKNKNLAPNSEEFLKKCGERFTEVVTETQVYDSVLARSGMMRSKDTGMKMATAFMAEPTTSFNMTVNAIMQGKRGNKKFTAGAFGAIAASIIVNSALVSLVYAARDDDEDETYIEKYLGSATTELIDGFNPLTYIPFIKDIWSIFQGYDVERSDMSLISDLWQSFEKLFGEGTPYEKVSGVSGALASVFGVPLKNILRDAEGTYNFFKTVTSGTPTTGAGIWYSISESAKDAIPLWGRLSENDSTSDRLYDAIMSGDANQIKRMKSKYDSQDKLNSAMKTALRENDPRIKEAAQARYDGDISEYKRIAKEIIAEGNFSQDIVVGAINAAVNAIKKGETSESEQTEEKDEATSIYKSSDVNAAFESGDNSMALEIIEDLINTKVANGMEEKNAKSSVRSSMTSYWKPLYIQAYQSRNSAEMERIRRILYASELYGNANEVVKTVQNWLKD